MTSRYAVDRGRTLSYRSPTWLSDVTNPAPRDFAAHEQSQPEVHRRRRDVRDKETRRSAASQ